MISPWGESLTHWTVRLALLGYFVGAGLRGGRPRTLLRQRIDRLAWTLGCLCYLLHVICAFHFYHGWSHAAAWHRTAQQTAAVTGWRSGGGLYLNYLFTAVWLADALWRLRWADRGQPRWLAVIVQVFLWFMVFNATVVFGHGAIRWFGLAGCGWLAGRAAVDRNGTPSVSL